jgi:hypothetical protein
MRDCAWSWDIWYFAMRACAWSWVVIFCFVIHFECTAWTLTWATIWATCRTGHLFPSFLVGNSGLTRLCC